MNTPNLQLYIADDNEGFAEFCSTVAAKENWLPVSCRDGAELLDALRSGTGPALVICDLNMPNLDGVQVAQALPEIQRNLRVRFITGGDQSFALAAHMISKINDMKAGRYLVKPISVSKLREVLAFERDEIRKFDTRS